MKFTLLITVLITISGAAFGQQKTIKPAAKKEAVQPELERMKYRTLEEVVGEKFWFIPTRDSTQQHTSFEILGQSKSLSNRDLAGKTLTLNKIVNDGDIKKAIFSDSSGVEYASYIHNGVVYDVALISDVQQAQKLYTGKSFWIKNQFLYTTNPTTGKALRQLDRFEKIKVNKVSFGVANEWPVSFLFETEKGEKGTYWVNVSGTNTKKFINKQDYIQNGVLENALYLQDPKILYPLTPAMWKNVESHRIVLGMPQDALELIKGKPDAVNTTTTAAGRLTQVVYRTHLSTEYYYFKNDKLTTIQK